MTTTTTTTDPSVAAAFDTAAAGIHYSMDQAQVPFTDNWCGTVGINISALIVNDDEGVDLRVDKVYGHGRRRRAQPSRPAVIGKLLSFRIELESVEEPGVTDLVALVDMVRAELLTRGLLWEGQYERFLDCYPDTRQAGVPYTLHWVVTAERMWRP